MICLNCHRELSLKLSIITPTLGGSLGIVQKLCLWASDVWFMNDAREASYGLDVIKRAIRSVVSTSDLEREVRSEVLKRLEEMPGQEDVLQSYIACLSKEGDQLSQWRAYGRPRGFSIGFDRRKLQRICTVGLELDKPSYRNITYDETIQVNMLSMILRTILNMPVGSPESRQLATIAWLFILRALALTPAFKDPAFEEEQEVRLQVFHDPKTVTWDALRFRNGAMGLTPYVEIPLKDPGADKMTAMREVTVGPQRNQDEAIRAVQRLLGRYEIEAVVRPSVIPLRS